jgi:hypothetical protein
MADFDLSQVDQGGVDGVDIFEQLTPALSADLKQLKATQSLILRDAERSPDQASIEMVEDSDQTYLKGADAHEQAVQGQLEDTLQTHLDNSPETFTDAVKAVDLMNLRRSEAAQSETAKEQKVVEAVAVQAPIDINERVQKEMVARMAAGNTIAELLEGQGFWDRAADIGGMLLPFGLAKDITDIDTSGMNWTNAASAEAFIIDYQALPAERKIEVFPEIAKRVLDATATAGVSDENTLKAAGILLRFLDPEGADRLNSDKIMDILLGAADVLPAKLVTGMIGHTAVGLKRGNNAAKVVGDMGDTGRAADITIAAAADDTIASATGVDRATVAMNAAPVDRSMRNPSYTAGLAPDVSQRLNEFQRQAEGLTRSIVDDQSLMRAGALNRYEKKAFIKNWEERMLARESDTLNEQVQVRNVRIVAEDDVGFRATYDLVSSDAITPAARNVLRTKRDKIEKAIEAAPARSKEKRKLVAELEDVVAELNKTKGMTAHKTEDVVFTTDSHGNFKLTTERSTPTERRIGSPAYWGFTKTDGADFNDSFKTAGVTEDVAAGFQDHLQTVVDEAWSPVKGNKPLRSQVEEALLKGDTRYNEDGTRGYVYTQQELAAEFDLTDPRAVESYYRNRTIADQFWIMENWAVRRRLQLNGFENAVDLGDDGNVAVRMLDSDTAAKQSFRNRSLNTGASAYDEGTGEVLDITDELIEQEYNSGRVLVRTSKEHRVTHADGSDEYVDYIFVNRERLQGLPEKVTHYKVGYVPKINKGIEYVVKETVPVTKRGVRNAATQKFLRGFASRSDANRFLEEQIRKGLDEGRFTDREIAEARIRLINDNEISPMQRIHDNVGSTGGLFSGARASDDILVGLTGQEVDRLGAYEALSRNARHLGNLVAKNEARIGDEQRWLNTVDLHGIDNKGFAGTQLGDSPIEKALADERRIIQAWNSIPSREETAMQGMLQHLHDWMLDGVRLAPGLQNKEAIDSILWLKHADPLASLRSASTHLLLGVLQPAQLYVQSAALTVAALRYPKRAPQAFAYLARMSLADNVRNPDSLAAISKRWTTDADTPLFEEAYTAWRKSGLPQSVRRNADIDVADKYGVMTADTMKKVSDASLLLYRNGELLNRRFSFVASYLEWKAKNPGKLPSKDDLLDINKDARLSMLELNAANRAWWQGGPNSSTMQQVLGTMTQFQQVATKSIELMFKGTARGGIPAAEKRRIWIGQMALFGAAGVPFLGTFSNEITDALGVELDSDTITQINQGAFIGTMLNALDADVDVASRGAPFGQLPSFVKELLFEDQPLIAKAFGASGTVVSRGWDAIKQLEPMMMSTYNSGQLTELQLQSAFKTIAKLPSSTRNALSADLMHKHHIIQDRHGNTLIRKDFNLATEIARGLGFRATAESRFRAIQQSNKEFQEQVAARADAWLFAANEYRLASVHGDKKQRETAAFEMQSLMSTLLAAYQDDPVMYSKVKARILEKMQSPKTVAEREVKRFIERTLPEKMNTELGVDRQKLGLIFHDAGIVRPLQHLKEERE